MEWKKAVSVLITAAVAGSAATAFAWQPQSDKEWEAAPTDGVAARFFVGSDVHIGRDNNASDKLENALNVFNTVDPNADAVLLVGDITNNGRESEYSTLMDIINRSHFANGSDVTKTILAMGNHEFNTAGGAAERFENGTGQDNTGAYYFYKNDDPAQGLVATVIKLGASNYSGDYTGCYDFLKSELEKANAANPEAPVIIMGHHGIRDTAYVTNEWYGNYGKGSDKDMVALLEQYPQAIHISGHSHATLEDARSIYQDDGYTAIQDATIGAYFENESGTVDPSSGSGVTRPADSEESSQALRIDVMDDGTVQIYRMDFTDCEYMYEETPWTFDANDVLDRPYTSVRTGEAPAFGADAEVTVSDADEKSVVVSFPSAISADESDNNDMISRYKVVLTDPETESSVTRYVFADYYKNPDRRRADWDVKITGLSEGTKYDVAVTAVTSFGQESAPITGEAQTVEDIYVTPTADVLDVDFERDNTGADANGRKLDVYGAPQIKHDDEIDRDVMVFDGVDDGLRYTMSRDIYEKLTSDITVELYYKPLDTKNNDPLGSTQSAGFCFEQKSGTNDLQAWVHVGGSYKKSTATVEKDKWNHVMFTYDGSYVKIYLNGEEKDSVSASGEMSIGPLYLFLGGDSKSDGSLEYPANCEIALAKVYTGAMNADDVKKTYDETVNGTPATPSPTATAAPTVTPSPEPTETPSATTSPAPTETPDENAVSASVSGPEHASKNELVPYVFSLSGNTEKLETMHLNFTISGSEEGMFLGQTLDGLNSCSVYAQQKETSENGDITYDVVMGYLPGTEDEVIAEIGDILQLNVRMASDKTGSVNVKLNSILFNSEVTGGVDSNADLVTTVVSDKYDVNGDGKLDLDDIADVQGFYRAESGEENWAEAEKADFNADGVIDLTDLVEISNAYLKQ